MASAACTVHGTHQFEIVGYSLIKGFAAGDCVYSGSFDVGGYRWSVRFYFYPSSISRQHRAHVAAFLKLATKGATARARYDLRLVHRGTGGLSHSVRRQEVPVMFDAKKSKRGSRVFMLRSKLEASSYQYLRDDRLIVECVVDVVSNETQVTALCRLGLPPSGSDLAMDLGDLLLNQEDLADVTLDVQGEVFRAHRAVLAARSPVFMARLYGQMKEKAMERIAIDDMQPVVFRAPLHFVYTDTLVLPGDLGGRDYREMVRHLLEAADRYAMERLKLICVGILCRSVDAATVETMLAFANRHYCQVLTDVCLQFMSLGSQG